LSLAWPGVASAEHIARGLIQASVPFHEGSIGSAARAGRSPYPNPWDRRADAMSAPRHFEVGALGGVRSSCTRGLPHGVVVAHGWETDEVPGQGTDSFAARATGPPVSPPRADASEAEAPLPCEARFLGSMCSAGAASEARARCSENL